MKLKISFLFGILLITQSLLAQEERSHLLNLSSLKGVEYTIRAGLNIGAVAPVPIPAEIRSFSNYDPGLSFSIEGTLAKEYNNKWGMMLGLRLENKGMQTEAMVKNYHISMVQGVDKMEGYFTGTVNTSSLSSLLTLPLSCTYNISSRWKVKGGPYFSYLLKGEFRGSAFDGYLRNETPIGEKIEISTDNPATYEFSKDMRPFLYGAQIGAEWKAFTHFNVYADFTWGLNSVFKNNFDAISFGMYPIYATIGFAYVF